MIVNYMEENNTKKVKIYILVAMIFGLCTLLSSCSPQEKAQYDESTNQKVSFHGISFQVPKAWRKPNVKEDKNNIAFSQWPNGKKIPKIALVITFEGNKNIKERIEEIKLRLDTDSKSDIHISNVKETDISIDNMLGKAIEYNQEMEGQKGYVKYVIMQKNRDIVELNFYSKDSIGLNDFNKVLESMVIEKN